MYRKEAETSYNVFHGFGKVLRRKHLTQSRGSPQMVSLYSMGERTFMDYRTSRRGHCWDWMLRPNVPLPLLSGE